MWPFKKKESTAPELLIDQFVPPSADSPKRIFQIGDFTRDNVQWWCAFYIADGDEYFNLRIAGPYFDYYEACAVAKLRGFLWTLIRTSAEENHSVETVLAAFEYQWMRDSKENESVRIK